MFGLGSDSSLPPLIGAGGGLVCESVGKADMLSDNFDGKQSRDGVDLPSTCHPAPSLTTFTFRSREVKLLLLDLDSYGGTNPLDMSPVFFEEDRRGSGPSSHCGETGSFDVCFPPFGWVAFLFAGEWLMSPQFQRAHLPPQHPIINQFTYTYAVLVGF